MEAVGYGARAGSAIGAIVFGMGRSGTSAVTLTLIGCGFYAGEDSELLGAHASNPAGHGENMAMLALNEEVLEHTGGTWFAAPTAEAQVTAAPWAEPRLRNLLQRLLVAAAGRPLVVKDPRMGVLLELWGPVIEGVLHPVLLVRNPVEIALSLASRDGTPTAFSLASWELHTVRLLAYLRGRTVTVAPYAQLVRSPSTATRVVNDVAAHIRAEQAASVDPSAATKTIQPSLQHQRAASRDAAEYLTRRQTELWRFLDDLSLGSQVLNVPPDLIRPNRTASTLVRCETQRVYQQRRLEERRLQLAKQRAQLDKQQAELVEQRGQLVAQQRRAEAAEYWLDEIQRSASWRMTRPLRDLRRAVRRARVLPIVPREDQAR